MSDPFRYFTSSPEVVRLVVMMYVRFPLSLRNVDDLLLSPASGPVFAADIPRQRMNCMRGFHQWRWHLDEMDVKMNGEMV